MALGQITMLYKIKCIIVDRAIKAKTLSNIVIAGDQ